MPPFSNPFRPALASLAAISVFAALLTATPACRANAGVSSVQWGPCPETWVGTPSGVLGDRLRCGTLHAPLDHVAPDGREIEVGVIRIAAAQPDLREGAIFFNRGGPGGHPGKLLRSMAEGWTRASVDDPDEADKHRLAQRFDLVAVVPRGLVGSSPVRCVSGLPPRHEFLPTHQDDITWAIALDETRAVATACTGADHARYINTEQHAHDMDLLRRELGDERLHFYGISYGGKVGAWYAAIYPDHTGRLLLDSTMDFTHDYRTALRLALTERQREFTRDVAAPLLADPVRFGLGNSADEVTFAIESLPGRARAAWAGLLDASPRLAAALRIAEWLDTGTPADLTAMTRRIRGAQFSPDAALDRRIRWDATQLAGVLYAPRSSTPEFGLGAEGDSVRTITACNDEPWLRDVSAMRESLRDYATRYMHFNGGEILEEMTCSLWGGHSARVPDLSPLGRASPFLLIQSERDTATPLDGGSFIVDRFANARMLLVRDAKLHGVFNFTASGCIEQTAAHYLLTGELPESGSRVFACADGVDSPLDLPPGTRRPFHKPVPVDLPPRADRDEL